MSVRQAPAFFMKEKGKQMKKGEILEGVVKDVRFPNKGILEIEGAPVIVKNAVPGQKIRFSVTKARSGRGEGRLLEVLEKAPGEIEPACPHFQDCGGCTYQNLPYEQQLAMKRMEVERLLREVCPELNFEGIKGSPREKEYRNKMEFSFGDAYKDGPLALGMHKRGSFYDIVTVDQCQIVDEDFRKILTTVLDFAAKTGFPYYHKLRHTGFWRHLLVRKGLKTGEVLVAVVTSSQAQVEYDGDWQNTSRLLIWRVLWSVCFISSMTAWQMWFSVMRAAFFLDGISSMKNCWGFVLRFLRFPSSRPIPLGRRCFMRQPEPMWEKRKIR